MGFVYKKGIGIAIARVVIPMKDRGGNEDRSA